MVNKFFEFINGLDCKIQYLGNNPNFIPKDFVYPDSILNHDRYYFRIDGLTGEEFAETFIPMKLIHDEFYLVWINTTKIYWGIMDFKFYRF